MANTEWLYTQAKAYQDKRRAIMNEYETRLYSLEDTKGSKYYQDETKKAEDKRDEALKALQIEYNETFTKIIKAMNEANARRTMKAPTEDELRLISALKMRENISENELTMIANAVKGNGLCLSIVQETAKKNNIMRNYCSFEEGKEMPFAAVESEINGLASSLRDFVSYDTTKAARLERKMHETHYGINPDAPALPKRALFNDKAGCFKELTGLTGDSLTAFCKAVDG